MRLFYRLVVLGVGMLPAVPVGLPVGWPLAAGVALAVGILPGAALAQQVRPDARKTELDRLFASLKAAPNEEAAAALEARIRQAWQQAGSPAVLLLLNRGGHDLQDGDINGALDELDDALVLAPDYAEAWLRRALAKFSAGDYPGAIRDIEASLQREPRNFVALQTLSHIAEAQQDWKGALAAWEKALEIDPRMPRGRERREVLRRKAFGEAT